MSEGRPEYDCGCGGSSPCTKDCKAPQALCDTQHTRAKTSKAINCLSNTAPEDAHPLATYPTDDTTDTPRLHDSITYKVPQIQPIVNKPAAAPAPRQHSTTEETTPSTGDWKNLPHTR
ncbi:hypothetical protein ROHU_004671 [Labeo rohita]|uniref:Uncharacterized protein n=1 Tax=Labeo rohita TaxID=84645 RepID=A0A498NKP2_LABRO|nr:hypothetical protein ROHU_004671 [Labeo rohita]